MKISHIIDKVMVIGMGTPIGLEVVRSLGSKGIKVFGVGTSLWEIGMASRYLHKRIIIDQMNLRTHIGRLMSLVQENNINFIIAIGEAQMVALNEFRSEIEKYAKLLFPPQIMLEKVLNKWETIKIAKRIGIPVPHSIIIDKTADIEKCRDIVYPVTVKPSRRHSRSGFNPQYDFRANYFYSFEELQKFLSYSLEGGIIPLVQERLSGEETCIGFLRANGNIKACCQFNFARSSEITGIPTAKEVGEPRSDLFGYGAKMLQELDWEGVALFDFIMDTKKNYFKLLEINGRFWGSTTVCVRAGVDFPYLLYLTVGKGQQTPFVDATAGTFVRNLGGDTKYLLRALMQNNRCRKSSASFVLDYLAPFFRQRQHEVQLFEDPLPGMLDVLLMVKKLLQR